MSDLRALKYPTEKTCEVCNTVFSRPKNWPSTSWKRTRFCSIQCGAIGRRKHRNSLDSFFDKIIPEPMSGCWLWTGTVSQYGYGQIRIDGTLHMAHRLSYEIHCGPIPEGMGALHHCDVRCCVNPDHLYAGTAADNNRDIHKRNRAALGEAHGMSKLTERAVREIRRHKGTKSEIARKLGVSHNTVARVVAGETWRHVQ